MKRLALLLTVLLLSACSSQFDEYMKDGRAALRSQDYERAAQAFDNALIEEPTDKDAAALLERARNEILGQDRQKFLATSDQLRSALSEFADKFNDQYDNLSAEEATAALNDVVPILADINDLKNKWSSDQAVSKAVNHLYDASLKLEYAFQCIEEDIHEPIQYDKDSFVSQRRAALLSKDSVVRARISMGEYQTNIDAFLSDLEALKVQL